MSVNTKFREVRGVEAPRSPAGRAPQPVAAHATQHVIMTAIGLGVAAHLARQRSSYEHAIMIALGLAAVAGLEHASRARTFARLAAWDKRRNLREHRVRKTRRA
jgi:hypothetical protein